jgi:preprotein translocase subunit SecY
VANGDAKRANPAAGLGEARFAELRQRLLFLLGGLIVYRIGTFIPVPGINPDRAERVSSSSSRARSWTCSTCSRAARWSASIFALGVMPYISASIIVQMMTSVVPVPAAS